MAAGRDASDHDLTGAAASPAILDFLKPFDHIGVARKTGAKHVGGKAASLGKLWREGFPVPRGWVIPARHFTSVVEATLPRGHDLAALLKLAETKAGVERAARARDRLLAEPLPEALSQAIGALWAEIEKDAPWGVAARSSATCEDREETSMAGLAATILGLRGQAAIEAGVRQVWASAFSPRALAYLAHAGVRDFGMAVVIQLMVRADAAGVMFTAPPPGLEGDQFPAGERLVHATLGLGAPIVEGATTADAIRLAKGGAVVARMIADKRRALVIGANGPEEIAVAEKAARAPALGPAALAELADLADRLEKTMNGGGRGVDVEFAVEGDGDPSHPPADGKVWVLQARPLTGGGFPDGGGADTVWSRTNLGEALPGPATPLTWSIASAFAEKGFREAFGALGCHVPRGTALVGNIQGRFYLNLTNFMRIAAQVPGLGPRALLGASGGATEAVIRKLEAEVQDVPHKGFLMRLPLSAPRELLRQANLEREVTAFEQEAARSRRVLLDLDLSLLPDDALVTTLRAATQLLDRTGTLMLACASASLAAHLALGRLLARSLGRRASAQGDATLHEGAGPSLEPQGVAQALVGGVRELESAGPGVALARVAEIARSERGAREALEQGKRTLRELPEGPTRAAIGRFLEEYGDRAVREAELATPRWREQPAQLLAMLASAMRAPPGEAERALTRARAQADAELARLETRVSSVELALVRTLVARVQKFTRLRERMRTWVTRVLGMIRVIALDVDRRLRRIDTTVPEGGVFFCTLDELLAALASGRAELGAVARLRRAEFVRDAARPDPAATFVGRPTIVALPPANGLELTGLPASSGVVEGRARVLEPGAFDLDTVRPGEVLISRTTDVGLSPLFLVAAAVVTELGGPLSHAAVVAREYGIPAVVSVAGATAAIRTGDRVRVDGDRGTVHKLDESGRSLLPPPPDAEPTV